MAKKPTTTEEKLRQLRRQLAATRAEAATVAKLSCDLIKDQGAKEQRIKDLEQQLADASSKADEAEHEAAHNMEEMRDQLTRAKEDAHYNEGLADGRKEAMDLLEGLVASAANNLKPLVGANLSELLAPMVPNADSAIHGIASIVRAMSISRASDGGKSGKGPAKGQDTNDQVGG